MNVKRPIDKETKEPIEPAHRFEVILEPDIFTEEKSVFYIFSVFLYEAKLSKDMLCMRIINDMCMANANRSSPRAGSKGFFAPE